MRNERLVCISLFAIVYILTLILTVTGYYIVSTWNILFLLDNNFTFIQYGTLNSILFLLGSVLYTVFKKKWSYYIPEKFGGKKKVLLLVTSLFLSSMVVSYFFKFVLYNNLNAFLVGAYIVMGALSIENALSTVKRFKKDVDKELESRMNFIIKSEKGTVTTEKDIQI